MVCRKNSLSCLALVALSCRRRIRRSARKSLDSLIVRVAPEKFSMCSGIASRVRTADGLTYHHSSATYPKGSFLKIARGVYVCAPELVFAQMASLLPFGALLSLGYELCGCYPVEASEYLVRHPLCSPNRLVAFCSHLRGFKGSAPAKTACAIRSGKVGFAS